MVFSRIAVRLVYFWWTCKRPTCTSCLREDTVYTSRNESQVLNDTFAFSVNTHHPPCEHNKEDIQTHTWDRTCEQLSALHMWKWNIFSDCDGRACCVSIGLLLFIYKVIHALLLLTIEQNRFLCLHWSSRSQVIHSCKKKTNSEVAVQWGRCELFGGRGGSDVRLVFWQVISICHRASDQVLMTGWGKGSSYFYKSIRCVWAFSFLPSTFCLLVFFRLSGLA